MTTPRTKGAKLTVNPQPPAAPPPSEAFGAKAKTVTVTDALGRELTCAKLTALNRMDVTLAVGTEGAANPTYFTYALLAASVRSINTGAGPRTVFPPASLADVRALVQELDEEGLAAVMEAWQQGGWLAEAASPEAYADAVGNAPASPSSGLGAGS